MPTFVHGKQIKVLVDSADMSGYFNSASIGNEVEMAESTTFGSNYRSYLVGWQAGTASLEGLFDGSVGAVDEMLSTALSATSPVVTVAWASGSAAMLVGKETKYDVSSPLGDVVSTSAEMTADGGIGHGVLLASAALNATFTGTASDLGASTSNGYVAHLHVTANTRNGTTTVKVQHSADNSTWVDLATFTSVPAGTATVERLTGTGTVERYLRAVATLGGTTGSVTITTALARR